ncbi:MAG: UDP-3-O-(3-hydroxymyristoyl)glucosamine N-acyltransferase [Bdellovibrio sp.]|jgi:UDP-3-O-[3-hydroxymyristoyl] glucosamine N-acyltransferase
MQSNIQVTARQIRALEGPYLKWASGSESAVAKGLSTPEKLQESQLVFIGKAEALKAASLHASILIVENQIKTDDLEIKVHQALFKTPSLKASMVLILPLFDPRQQIKDPLLSPGAHIHSTAVIGEGTQVDAGAVIGAFAKIGQNCRIHSGAVVMDFCEVGNHCTLSPNCTIGSAGFGYATDPQGHHHHVPHIGIVVLEDHVEVGSGTTIDRATIGETRVGQGTKFDNLCHVAHNCKIGKHGLFAGGFMVAGSSVIGDHFVAGGSALITDHVTICDRVTLGGRAAVTKDIKTPGAYTGYPLEPLKDGLKTIQNLKHLTNLRQQIKLISKRLGMAAEQE